MRQCLSDEEIAELIAGTLVREQRPLVKRHVRECKACTARIKRTLWALKEGAEVVIKQFAPPVEAPALFYKLGPRSDMGESRSADESQLAIASEEGTKVAVGDSAPPVEAPALVNAVATQPESDESQRTEESTPAEVLAATPQSAPVPSVEALGNYVILEKLGQGGMGTVFKARHRRMNRLVALKVLPQSVASLPEATSRFQREVEVAARLHHPNIATAFDADEAGGVLFLAMEFVDGPNLASYVEQRGPLPLSLAVALVEQAARGLSAAHALGVVHRDIKPSNLMVNQEGVVKVLDVGLARMPGESSVDSNSLVTQAGRTLGTVDFMAPEQARDATRVDPRTDIYSLGCTLYYLATGKTPAPSGSTAQKLLWHQAQEAAPLSMVCRQSTPRIDALLAKMMAKKPEQRFASMDEVASGLAECARELPAFDARGLFGGLENSGDQEGQGSSFQSKGRYRQRTRDGLSGDTKVSNLDDRALNWERLGEEQLSGWLLHPITAGVDGNISHLQRATWNSRIVLAGGTVAVVLSGLILAFALMRGRAPPAVESEPTISVMVDGGPAAVLINSKWQGQTVEERQLLEFKVQPGKVLVQVHRDGFEPYEERVETETGRRSFVLARLQRAEQISVGSAESAEEISSASVSADRLPPVGSP